MCLLVAKTVFFFFFVRTFFPYFISTNKPNVQKTLRICDLLFIWLSNLRVTSRSTVSPLHAVKVSESSNDIRFVPFLFFFLLKRYINAQSHIQKNAKKKAKNVNAHKIQRVSIVNFINCANKLLFIMCTEWHLINSLIVYYCEGLRILCRHINFPPIKS